MGIRFGLALLVAWACAAGCGPSRGEEAGTAAFSDACVPETCASVGATCGEAPDGCGGSLMCGTCESGTTCGGGGTPNLCGSSSCQPRTCSDLVLNCGTTNDGCGGALECGTCAAGMVCGGGGLPNVCGAGSCGSLSCGDAECGRLSDACGESIQCGGCEAGAFCDDGNRCRTAASMSCADADLGTQLPVRQALSPTRAERLTGCGAEGHEVLFGWTAPFAGAFVIDTAGSTFRPSLALREGSCEGAVLACHEAIGGDGAAKLVIEARGGERFAIHVDGALSASETVVLHIGELTAKELGASCLDGADNDGDGRVDCDDPDCASEPSCEESEG